MPPTKTDTGHGSLFDLFPDRPSAVHGGARFDEGFGLQDKDSPKGALFDEFGAPAHDDGGHSELWDEFAPWRELELHGGQLYDEAFAQRSAHETERGPLFDLFQPGTQAKFIFDGQDAEGIVQGATDDAILVQPRGGGDVVEVGLEQFLAYASPSVSKATTRAPRSSAEAPSASSADARGGQRGAAPSPGRPVEPTPQGQYTEPRSGIPEGAMSIVDQLKSVLDGIDVQKISEIAKAYGDSPGAFTVEHKRGLGHIVFAPGSAAPHSIHPRPEEAHTAATRLNHHLVSVLNTAATQSGSPSRWSHSRDTNGQHHITEGRVMKTGAPASDVAKEHIGFDELVKRLVKEGRSEEKAKAIAAAIGRRKYGEKGMEAKAEAAKTAGLPSDVLKNYSVWGRVAKEVTVAETAVQAQEGAAPFAGDHGAGSYCPECRATKKKLTDDGRCPDCNTVLKAHDGGVARREKGDGNGSAESSEGAGVAEKTLDDLRKAFGAGGDARPGGQTVTLTGKPEEEDAREGQATSDPSGPEIPERPHAETDHHEDGSKPGTCPHCGQALSELDRKTEEGAPAHKCLEGFMDALKVAA